MPSGVPIVATAQPTLRYADAAKWAPSTASKAEVAAIPPAAGDQAKKRVGRERTVSALLPFCLLNSLARAGTRRDGEGARLEIFLIIQT